MSPSRSQPVPRSFSPKGDERGVRADVHAPHRRGRKEAAWRLGNNVINRLIVVTGYWSSSVSCSPRRCDVTRRQVRSRHSDAGRTSWPLTISAPRIMLPTLTLIAVPQRDGDAQLAAALFHPRNSGPAMFNVVTIVVFLRC